MNPSDKIKKGATTLSRPFLVFKRLLDIITSIFILPMLAFVCIVALILNPFFNPGRLFYTQKRIGLHNKPFILYKLRTMQGANETELFATQETTRITRLGRFMRDIHIDELPQILNVFLGTMSLIGPRPEQPQFFEKYKNSIVNFEVRQTIKPGISGLAQLKSGYSDDLASARRKLKWDIQYIQNLNLKMELHIYIETYKYIFTRIAKKLLRLR